MNNQWHGLTINPMEKPFPTGIREVEPGGDLDPATPPSNRVLEWGGSGTHWRQFWVSSESR